jgi:hypothetical protein
MVNRIELDERAVNGQLAGFTSRLIREGERTLTLAHAYFEKFREFHVLIIQKHTPTGRLSDPINFDVVQRLEDAGDLMYFKIKELTEEFRHIEQSSRGQDYEIVDNTRYSR